ncbi:hypothetical protein KR018_008967, partial [Drosophila ironensis]
ARKLPPNPEQALPPSHTQLHRFSQAAICCDVDICSALAKDVLERGGSAVDGTLVSLLCNGILGIQSMGLGGGMLMNIYSHRVRKSFSILARETAPSSLSPESLSKFHDEQVFRQTSLSIGLPMELAGYAVAHQRFGRLPWSELVAPATELCRKGFQLYKHLSDSLAINKDGIYKDAALREMFVDPKTDKFWPIGSHVQPPRRLCVTYARLAMEGPWSFYNGSLAEDLLKDLEDIGSVISRKDLAGAMPTFRESLVMPLEEYDLHLTPPPGSGYIVGFIMQVLLQFRKDFAKVRGLQIRELHRLVEAMKFGFVKRWQLDESTDSQFLENLSSLEMARSIAKQIVDLQTFNDTAYYGAPLGIQSWNEHGTAHTSLLFKNDAVSVTSSINFYFGSCQTGKRTGVLFNNAMSDFGFENMPNYFEIPFVPERNIARPLARPMSSMSPTIVTERATGKVRLVVGAAGGTKIISALVPLLVRMLWQGEDLKTAIDASRIHHQMLPNTLYYEYGLIQSQVEQLEKLGHQCKRFEYRGSIICGISQENDTIFANSDFRKLGGLAGF